MVRGSRQFPLYLYFRQTPCIACMPFIQELSKLLLLCPVSPFIYFENRKTLNNSTAVLALKSCSPKLFLLGFLFSGLKECRLVMYMHN